MQERGGGLIIVSSLIDRAEGYFDANGERQADGYFYKDEIALYGEYGLTETETLIARLAFQQVEQRFGENFDQAEGLAASQVGIRRQIFAQGAQVLSLQGSFFIPGDGENITNQPLGEGERAYELRFLAGQSFGEGGFGDVQIGYRAREGRYLDEIHFDTAFGIPLGSSWRFGLSSFSVWSAEAERPGAPEFIQHKIQISLLRRSGALDFEIGLMATPAGQSALDERALFLSSWRRF